MVREREEIDEKYRWSLEKVYESDEKWENEFENVGEEIEEFEEYRGELGSSGEKLLKALKQRDRVMRKVRKLSSYARMKSHEDTRKQKYQALSTRASELSSRAASATSFFGPEIQQIPEERMEEFFDVEGLERYRHEIENTRRMKPHTLSPEMEDMLSDLGDVLNGSEEIYSLFMNADLEFPEVETAEGRKQISLANFTSLLKNSDRDFRRRVYTEFYDTISEYRNTVSKTLETQVRTHVKLAKRRNYGSALEAALKPSNIPVEVYDNLLEVKNSNLEPLHDHLELKREILGVEELEMHDVYMPMAEDEIEIEFEEAKKHVLEALAPLGEDYVEKVKEGIESGWIDVYENSGKRSGAYSGGSYDTDPYILMNYQGDIPSMYTLAHELGHSMHSLLTEENQPFVDSDYDLFLAEIASTVNEALLTRHLLENVEDEHFRRHVLSHSLENFRSTFYRQSMFAEFEREIHEELEDGNPLTPDFIDEKYIEQKKKLFRPAKLDERIEKEWMRIPHFYYRFYVFQYATGISAATSLASSIVEGGTEERENYLEFLKSGGSDYPLEILEKAGIDMTEPEPIRKAIQTYRDQIDEMRELIE